MRLYFRLQVHLFIYGRETSRFVILNLCKQVMGYRWVRPHYNILRIMFGFTSQMDISFAYHFDTYHNVLETLALDINRCMCLLHVSVHQFTFSHSVTTYLYERNVLVITAYVFRKLNTTINLFALFNYFQRVLANWVWFHFVCLILFVPFMVPKICF